MNPQNPIVNIGQNYNDLLQNAEMPQARQARVGLRKRKLDLLGREKKKVKVKGWEEKVLTELVKQRKRIGDNLDNFKLEYRRIANEENVPDARYNFFRNFMNSTTDVRKLPIAKNLAVKPVLIPIYQVLNLTFVTNDSLFWYFKLSVFRGLAYSNLFGNLSHIYLCSNRLVRYNVETNINEFFFEDFNQNVSSPNWKLNTTQNQNDIGNAQEFSMFGKNYSKYPCNNNGDIYAVRNMTKADILNALNGMKKVHMKGQLSEGMKQEKKKGDFYYNGKIKITDFCPSTLERFEETGFGTLSFFVLDPNLFVNNCKQVGNAIPNIPNFFFWDYIHSSMELVGIVHLTTNSFANANDETQRNILQSYNSYLNNKDVVNEYKAHYFLFRRIILNFLDGFRTRASIDKMRELYKLTDDYITEDARVKQFQEQEATIRLIVTNIRTRAAMMFNYLVLNSIDYIKIVRETASYALNSTVAVENLAGKLRAACLKLTEILFNGTRPMIDAIRSVNSFLGSVTGGDLNAVNDLALRLVELARQQRLTAEEILGQRRQNYLAAGANTLAEMRDVVLAAIRGVNNLEDGQHEALLNLVEKYILLMRVYNQNLAGDQILGRLSNNKQAELLGRNIDNLRNVLIGGR